MTVLGGQKTEGRGLMLSLLYAFVPLLVLLTATFLACILAYVAVMIWDDAISFRTFIKKASQVFLVLSIFPAMRYLKLNRLDLGFAAKPIFFKQIAQGFSLGFITLIPVFLVLYWLGIDVVDTAKSWTIVWISKKLALELALALLISLFEEPVFRGILLTGLSRKFSIWAAICISAFYYASLHFVNTQTQIPASDITLFSGFKLVGEAFAQLLKPQIWSAFGALFAVGVFLGLLRIQVKASLGLCIGCHACWVWQIKLSKDLLNTNLNSDYLFLVSSYDGVIGPLVTTWLILAIIVFYMYLHSSEREKTD